jgi:hypothetical protein
MVKLSFWRRSRSAPSSAGDPRRIAAPCSKCGATTTLMEGVAAVIYAGTRVAARTSSLSGRCLTCKSVYCSLHAIWQMLEVPGFDTSDLTVGLFMSHCPDCGSILTGA